MSALAGGGVNLGLLKGGPKDGDHLVPFFRRGAGDEGPGSDFASHRRAVEMVPGGRDSGNLGSPNAPVETALRTEGLRWAV